MTKMGCAMYDVEALELILGRIAASYVSKGHHFGLIIRLLDGMDGHTSPTWAFTLDIVLDKWFHRAT